MMRLASSRAPVSELSSEERVDRSAPAAPALATSSPADATTPSSWALSSDKWFDICALTDSRCRKERSWEASSPSRLSSWARLAPRACKQLGLDLLERLGRPFGTARRVDQAGAALGERPVLFGGRVHLGD